MESHHHFGAQRSTHVHYTKEELFSVLMLPNCPLFVFLLVHYGDLCVVLHTESFFLHETVGHTFLYRRFPVPRYVTNNMGNTKVLCWATLCDGTFILPCT